MSYSIGSVNRTALFWVFLAALAPLGIWHNLHSSYSWVDPAEAIYHAREVAAGRIPYRDIFSHHFLGYLFPLALIEGWHPITPQFFWLLAVVNQLLCALFVCLTVQELADHRSSQVAALATVTIGWFPGWYGDLFVNQNYYWSLQLLFLWSSLRAASRARMGWYAMAGLTFGGLVTLDQRLLVFGVLLFALLLRPGNLKNSAALIGTAAVLPATAVGYLYQHGALADFWYQTIVFPGQVRNAGLASSLGARLLELFSGAFNTELPGVVLGCAGLGLFLIFEQRTRRYLILLGFTLCSLLCAVMGGRAFINYMLFLGPAALVLIGVLPFCAKRLGRFAGQAAGTAVITLCALSAAQPALRYFKFGTAFVASQETTLLETADYIQSSYAPTATLFVWGYAPQLYLLTDRLSPFRDLSLLSVVGGSFRSDVSGATDISPALLDEFKTMLRERAPDLLVVYAVRGQEVLRDPGFLFTKRMPTTPYPQCDLEQVERLSFLKRFIEERYQLVQSIDRRYDYAVIYQRQQPAAG